MSKRLLTILLFISLAFNIAVVGSLLWLRVNFPRPPQPRFEHHERIVLPDHLRSLPWDPGFRDMRGDYDSCRIRLLRELAKDDYSEKDIKAIIDSSIVAQANLEEALGLRLLKIRNQMTAQEAEEYFGARAAQLERRGARFQNILERRQANEKDSHNGPNTRPWHRRPDGTESP